MTLSKATVAAFAFAAAGFGVSVAQAEDLTFTLNNNTNSTMTRFYTSPVGVNDWEEDVFGRDTLGPGGSTSVTIADGRSVCEYDMKFEFDDGTSTEATADLCSLGSYTINE